MTGVRDGWMMMVAAVVVGMLCGAGRADEGITVQGVGSAKARPTQVEIDCTLSGDAELASDATVKFRDAKKRALAAIEALKNKDLSVTSDGLSINNALDSQTQMMIMRGGGGGAPPKPRVQITEKNHIVLSNADKLEPEALLETILKVLDVAKDAGFQVGQAPPTNYYEAQVSGIFGSALVTFKVADGAALRDQAYKVAIENAREKAQKLAELSGVKVGRVLSIQEPVAQAGKAEMNGIPNYIAAAIAEVGAKASTAQVEKALTSTTAGDLTKQVRLVVQFEILK